MACRHHIYTQYIHVYMHTRPGYLKTTRIWARHGQTLQLLQSVLKEGIIKGIGRSRLYEDGSQLFYWSETSQTPSNMATTANLRTQV